MPTMCPVRANFYYVLPKTTPCRFLCTFGGLQADGFWCWYYWYLRRVWRGTARLLIRIVGILHIFSVFYQFNWVRLVGSCELPLVASVVAFSWINIYATLTKSTVLCYDVYYVVANVSVLLVIARNKVERTVCYPPSGFALVPAHCRPFVCSGIRSRRHPTIKAGWCRTWVFLA